MQSPKTRMHVSPYERTSTERREKTGAPESAGPLRAKRRALLAAVTVLVAVALVTVKK
jgi:hypothetical protein